MLKRRVWAWCAGSVALGAIGVTALLLARPSPTNATSIPSAAVTAVALSAPALLEEEQMTWEDVGRLAEALNATAYGRLCTTDPVTLMGEVLTVTEVEHHDGNKTPPGRVLDSPQLKSGVVQTRAALEIWIGGNYWDDAWEGELLVLGSDRVGGYDEMCGGGGNCCSVSCSSGTYACCNPAAGAVPPCRCRCVPNGGQAECHSGGIGATSCSIGYPNP